MSLSIPTGLILLLFTNLALLLLAAIFYSARRHQRTRPKLDNPHIFRCESCGHVYMENRSLPMAECDICGTMNEAIKL